MVKYGIHPNRSKVAKYLNLALMKSAILIVRISQILHLTNERSYLARSTKVRKLSSKEGGGGACYNSGGAHGGMRDSA